MTQTPRDWKKDEALLQLCQSTAADENERHALSVGIHWLQEAKTLQDKLKELVEIIEYEADLADLRGAEIHARELRTLVATLYPYTPAPKEGKGIEVPMTLEYGGKLPKRPRIEVEEGDNQ